MLVLCEEKSLVLCRTRTGRSRGLQEKLDTSRRRMERSRALPSRNEWGERRRFTNEWHFRYLHKERVMFEA